jgi:lipid A 3-O-deacylase
MPGWFGLSVDAISHYGASLGNVATYANVGGEVRIGFYLPDDFGTSAIRPGGDNASPLFSASERRGASPSSGLHAFASLDGRAVARNIFLDGNTFRDSAKVSKKDLVADVALGLAWLWKTGKISYAHYLRTKEFKGQDKPQSFGSLTLSLNF